MIKDFIKEVSKSGFCITGNQLCDCAECDRDDIYGWTEIKSRDGELKMSQDKKSNYYDTGNIETIEIIKAKLTHEQYIGYLLGNVIKYACRLNFKGHKSRDSEKLANYSKWLNDEINNGVPVFDCRLDAEKDKHE
jgi:hypothetical protein